MKRCIVLALAGCMAGAVFAEEFDFEVAESYEPSPEVAAYNDALSRYSRDTLDALVADGTAESLRLAGLMVAGRTPPPEFCESGMSPICGFDRGDEEEILRRALVMNPDDALLHWAAAQDRAMTERPTALISRLQEIAPDNAAVHVLALTDAPDRQRVDALLVRATYAARFDIYYADRVRAYLEAFDRLPVPPALLEPPEALQGLVQRAEHVIQILAFGLALADVMSLQPLLDACRDAIGERLETCLRLGEIMVREPDSMLSANIGVGLLRMLAPDQPGRWQPHERRLAWLTLQAGMAALDEASYLDTIDVAYRRPGATELSATREIVRLRGVPLVPPSQWESGRERNRRLGE